MNKKKTKTNKSNSKNSNLVAIVSAFASLIAAIIAIITIWILIHQHRTSIKPDITINDSRYILFCENYSTTYYVNFYITNSKVDTSVFFNYKAANDFLIKPVQQRNSFYFSPKNIGRGVAKDITLKWEFDTNLAISLLLKHKKIEMFDTVYLTSKSALFKVAKDTIYYPKKDFTTQERINYILPIDSEKENQVNIQIPDFYFNLYAQFTILRQYISLKSNLAEEVTENFPDLLLKFEYKDISNNKYENYFRLKLKNLSTGAGLNENSIEVKSIQTGEINFIKLN